MSPFQSSLRRTQRGLIAGAIALVALALAAPAPGMAAPGSADPHEVVVKLRDDTNVTARHNRLELASASAQRRLDALVGPARTTVVAPAFTRDPKDLDADRSRALFAGKRTPDLTTWFRVRIDADENRDALLAELKRDPLVEHADPAPASMPQPSYPAGSDLRPLQRPLLGSGPGGMGFDEIAGLPGGLGDRVTLAVNEGRPGAHEDLPDILGAGVWGNDPSGASVSSHAMGTFGVLSGLRNGFGIDGVAPQADTHLVYTDGADGAAGWASILDEVFSRMHTGDVYLMEAQDGTDIGPGLTRDGIGTFAPKTIVPIFADTIQAAVARGIIVVLPAGNGKNCGPSSGYSMYCPGIDPDDSGYNLDQLDIPDVGAIVVGAGIAPRGTTADTTTPCAGFNPGNDPVRGRVSFGSWGARTIQVQGPAGCVPTTSWPNQWEPTEMYSDGFNGTSSASAVVAGAAAALSSAYEAKTGRPLTPALARTALVAGGSPQDTTGARSGPIGPLPNVARSLDYLTTPPDTTVTWPAGTPYLNTPQPSLSFASNWPSGVTFECSVGDVESDWEPCVSGWTPAPQPERAVLFRVRAVSPAGPDPTPVMKVLFFDYTPPETTIDSGPADGAIVTTSGIGYTFSSSTTRPTFECQLDAGAWSTCSSPHTVSGLTSGSHTFRVRAIDRAGNTDATPADATFTVPSGRALGMTTAAPAESTVDLTGSPAAVDWVHWKANGVWMTPDRAAVATPLISGLEKLGSGPINLLDGASLYSWTNAQGTAVGSSRLGVGTGGADGRGYRVRVAPGTLATRTLRIYVGAAGPGAGGRLRAYFPGQQPIESATLTTSSWSYTDRSYEVTYRPASATDTLTVEWVQSAGASAGRVVLYGAQLR